MTFLGSHEKRRKMWFHLRVSSETVSAERDEDLSGKASVYIKISSSTSQETMVLKDKPGRVQLICFDNKLDGVILHLPSLKPLVDFNPHKLVMLLLIHPICCASVLNNPTQQSGSLDARVPCVQGGNDHRVQPKMEICHNSTSLSWNQSSSGNDLEKLGRLVGDMEFQDQLESDGSRYLHSQPPAAFDRGCGTTAGRSADAHCNIWMDAERTATRNYNNLSLAMNARLRLESLKSGYNSAAPRCVTGGLLDKYKHLCDDEDSQESILDSVELLDVEDDVQDEESWLYQPSKTTFENRSQSALGWCRHVLDNPSPETEAACRSLINKLQHCSDRYFHRCPAVFRHSGSVGSSGPQTSHSAGTDSLDYSGLNSCSDATNPSYKLLDITDVHIVARMQEASLRHDFNSTPVSRRAAEPSATFPSYFDTFDETTQIKSGASLSPCWRSDVPTLNPSRRSLTSLESQRGCQSPKLSRLQQQVTQFKLLKLAQNQGAPTVQTRSPLRTSLRSLQAVRNSRSLDTDDYQPPDSQITYQPSGASADKLGSRFWSPSLLRPAAVLRSVRDHEKRQQRSQSASPHRIPHSARAHLSIIGRVFASPERGTAPAWARGGPSTQR